MPHLGCTKPPCTDARTGKRRAEKVACLGLINRATGDTYLFDATPDFPAQVHALTGGKAPTGIFLTHGHIGHYTGLMFLGKETMGANDVPVYGTARMADYLSKNGPWSLLVSDKRIALRPLDKPVELPGGVRVTAFTVPHRDEFTDTVGYLIEGPRAKAVFIPDIDKWEKWDRSIRELCDTVDLAFLDATFASLDELPHRDLSKVPHPLMTETRALVAGTRAKLWFIHLNHSNPALVDGTADVAREGMEFDL